MGKKLLKAIESFKVSAKAPRHEPRYELGLALPSSEAMKVCFLPMNHFEIRCMGLLMKMERGYRNQSGCFSAERLLTFVVLSLVYGVRCMVCASRPRFRFRNGTFTGLSRIRFEHVRQ